MADDQRHDLRNETLRYATLVSERDLTNVAVMLHDDAVLFDPGEKEIVGRESIVAFMGKLFALDPVFRCEVANIWLDGAVSILEFQLTIGSARIAGVDVIEWRDGRIARIRAYVDPV